MSPTVISIKKVFLYAFYVLFLIISTNWSSALYAQAYSIEELSDARAMVRELRYVNADSVFKHLDEMILRSLLAGDEKSLAELYFLKGSQYEVTQQKKLSLSNYYRSLMLFRKLEDKRGIIKSLRSISVISYLTNQQRLDLLKEAEKTSLEIADSANLSAIYINMGTIYQKMNASDSAMYYYNKSLKIPRTRNIPILEAGVYTNIGNTYYREEKCDEAYHYFRLAATRIEDDAKNLNDYSLTILANLMNVHNCLNNIDSLFYYYDKIKYSFTRRSDLAMGTYQTLALHYEKSNDHETANLYLRKADSVKDHIYSESDENHLKSLEFEEESKQKEVEVLNLHAEVEKARYVRTFLLSILVIGLLFSGITFYQIRTKARKKRELLRARQKLISSELKNAELQRDRLNEQLKYTHKELTSFATNIVQNLDVISDLRSQIHSIRDEKNIKSIQEQMKSLDNMLLRVYENNAQRQEFIKRSRELNHKLIYFLKSHFPQLIDSDINFLILILLKFTSKEISILYNIVPTSVDQRRYRIRQKLDMDHRETFEEFFERMLPEVKIKADDEAAVAVIGER